MAEGKYFIIRSKLGDSSLVLDVLDGCTEPETRVCIQEYNNSDSQKWYEDVTSRSIRNKQTGFCLDVNLRGHLTVNECHEDDSDQVWTLEKDVGRILHDRSGNVLDVAGAVDAPGTVVCAWEQNDGVNQHWTFEHLPPQYFWIVSKLNGRVLDVKGDSEEPGEEVIMYNKKDEPSDNQMWYEGSDGVIRCKLGNFALDSSDGEVKTAVYDSSNENQQWVIKGDTIVQKHNSNLLLDIKGKSKKKGANLCAYEDNGGDNQRWQFENAN